MVCMKPSPPPPAATAGPWSQKSWGALAERISVNSGDEERLTECCHLLGTKDEISLKSGSSPEDGGANTSDSKDLFLVSSLTVHLNINQLYQYRQVATAIIGSGSRNALYN